MSENMNLNDDEKQRKILAESISKSFYNGEMPYIFYRLIDKCLFEYKFETEVVYQLFSINFEQNTHRSLTLMEEMALKWHSKGYNTAESLKKFLWQDLRIKEIVAVCGKLMRKRLNGIDIERIISWVENYDVSAELVTQAFKANDYRANLTLKNIGDTLAKWHENGIKTTEEAIDFCEKEHQENIKKKIAREELKELQKSGIMAVDPIWHDCAKEMPTKDGPYLVTQKQHIPNGDKITVEKRWFRYGEWSFSNFEKTISTKIEILAWALLPKPYVPPTE